MRFGGPLRCPVLLGIIVRMIDTGHRYLVSAADKAMQAINRRCAFLHISDVKRGCSLFDSLVPPIPSHASDVSAGDDGTGQSAEQLHIQ